MQLVELHLWKEGAAFWWQRGFRFIKDPQKASTDTPLIWNVPCKDAKQSSETLLVCSKSLSVTFVVHRCSIKSRQSLQSDTKKGQICAFPSEPLSRSQQHVASACLVHVFLLVRLWAAAAALNSNKPNPLCLPLSLVSITYCLEAHFFPP